MPRFLPKFKADATELAGDTGVIDDRNPNVMYLDDRDEFGNIIDVCRKNPNHTGCHYSIKDGFWACVFCGEESGLI